MASSGKSKKIGLPPGSLVHVGSRRQEKPLLDIYCFSPADFEHRQNASLEDCRCFRERGGVVWVNLEGIHDVSLVEKLGSLFDIHPLALEDILDTSHPPKQELFEDNLLILLKTLTFKKGQLIIDREQVSLVLGKDYVISFQERDSPEDTFDSVRKRLEKNGAPIRRRGADYLAYALFDSVVDNYFLILDHFSDCLAELEEELTTNPTRESLSRIHHFRNELGTFRKAVRPLREISGSLLRSDCDLLQEPIRPFLRDLYDHVIQVIDTVEIYRESLANLLDLYLSSASYRMNEVMQVLTVIATIFIPLTFIVGVYGMNFHFMPELSWRWGYPLIWLVMLACVYMMIAFFRKKGWF
jgi:magnesium transporter